MNSFIEQDMQESSLADINAMYGIASDGTLVYVAREAFDNASLVDRLSPNWWLEQLPWNKAVWTE